MSITWFKKTPVIKRRQLSDVSVRVNKGHATVYLRNDFAKEISPETMYVMFGVTSSDPNTLVFMASDAKNGWKASKHTNNGKPCEETTRIQINDEKTVTMLQRFIGEYSMELYEDSGTTLYSINRRNVL